MKEDCRSAPKRFWQTVRHLRKGRQFFTNTVYSGSGELLTSTMDVIGWWKEYFEDLLNPIDTPSVEEAEMEDLGVDSSISQTEVTELVCKLRSGRALGLDEIRPEYLKSLDVMGLSWLTRLCNIGDHTLQPPQKSLCQGTGEEKPANGQTSGGFRRTNVGFRQGRGTLDQLYTLTRVLKGLLEFVRPVQMCFVYLEKAFDRVPRSILWGVLWEYRIRGTLLRAVRSLYDRSRSLVRIAGRKSDLFPVHIELRQGCSLSPVLFIIFIEFLGATRGRRGSGSGTTGFHLCYLQMVLSCTGTVEEFKYLGILFTSEGRMEREIDRRIGAAAAVMRLMYCSVVVKKELSLKLAWQHLGVPPEELEDVSGEEGSLELFAETAAPATRLRISS
ncbi:hypothetical protein QQF64_033096 [Cirrhinus molitorella]|uniref:Reverse transcriptase domain-containing protein n=1 Tax=Cirrhinus molitorella TaxID=172907 RepID=A0ABR3MSX6_9TELE